MKDVLRSIYYSKKHNGLLTAQQLADEARKRYVNITVPEAQAWIDKQENVQRFKKPSKQLYNSITAPIGTYQCDLLFLKQHSKLVPVLVMVEITTRKGYFRVLPDKTTKSTAAALQDILTIADPPIDAVEHDSGSEFLAEFKDLLEANSITIVQYPRAENSKTALGKVERLNGTIRRWFNKSFKGQTTVKVAIPKIETYYNNHVHSATGMKPNDIKTEDTQVHAQYLDIVRGSKARRNITTTYKVGMKVRVKLPTDIFQKKSEARWSKDTHKITEKQGFNFKVDDKPQTFRAWELLPINAPVGKAPKQAPLPPPPTPTLPPQPKQGTRERTKATPTNVKPTAKKQRQPKIPKMAVVEDVLGHSIKKTGLVFKIKWNTLPEPVWEPAQNFIAIDDEGDKAVNPRIEQYLQKLQASTKPSDKAAATKLDNALDALMA